MEKKQSKLYTEEQVIQMIEKSRETFLTAEFLILTTPPIELPTDEEIDTYVESTGYYGHCTTEYREGIEEGAKWMRDKIKGGDNE